LVDEALLAPRAVCTAPMMRNRNACYPRRSGPRWMMGRRQSGQKGPAMVLAGDLPRLALPGPRRSLGWGTAIAVPLDCVVAGELTRLMIYAPPQHGKSELASKRGCRVFCFGVS